MHLKKAGNFRRKWEIFNLISSLFIKTDKLYTILLNWYYPIMLTCYLFTYFKKGLHTGWIAASMMILLVVCRFAQNGWKLSFTKYKFPIFVYFIWMIGSGIHYIYNDIPLSFFVSATFGTILPISFVLFSKNKNNNFLKNFLISYSIAGVIGLVLMIVRPLWYVEYCASYGYSHIRLSYFIGSITMGCFGAVALIISLKMVIDSKGRKYKFLYFIALGCTFASWQRSAWIVAIITLVIAHYYIYGKWKALGRKFLGLEFLIALIVLIVSKDIIIEILSLRNAYRIRPKTGMIESRAWTWIEGIHNSNIVFGSGYGSRGHKALAIGIPGAIGDGSWMNLLCEIGILGLCLFGCIIIKALIKSYRHIKELYMPMGIILVICLQSVGSNMFESQLIMPLFWYSIGLIMDYEVNVHKFKEYSITK